MEVMMTMMTMIVVSIQKSLVAGAPFFFFPSHTPVSGRTLYSMWYGLSTILPDGYRRL